MNELKVRTWVHIWQKSWPKSHYMSQGHHKGGWVDRIISISVTARDTIENLVLLWRVDLRCTTVMVKTLHRRTANTSSAIESAATAMNSWSIVEIKNYQVLQTLPVLAITCTTCQHILWYTASMNGAHAYLQFVHITTCQLFVRTVCSCLCFGIKPLIWRCMYPVHCFWLPTYGPLYHVEGRNQNIIQIQWLMG